MRQCRWCTKDVEYPDGDLCSKCRGESNYELDEERECIQMEEYEDREPVFDCWG